MLDTNVLIKDYYFKSQSFETIFKYLKTSGQKIILPQIVVSELIEKYKRSLEEYNEKIDRLNDSNRKLEIKKPATRIDIDEHVKEYRKFIDSVIKNERIVVINTNLENYKKIIEKAIKKLPPFKQVDGNDSGFKDAVIWESFLQILKERKYSPVAFITNNFRDFSDPDNKDELKPFLKEEIGKFDYKYFVTLESFLEKYGTPLLGTVTKEGIFKSVFEYLVNGISEEELEMLFKFSSTYPIELITKDSLSLQLDNYYVYKADESRYYINGTGTMSVWATVYDPFDYNFEGEYLTSSFTVSLNINKKNKEEIVIDGIRENEPEFF